MKLASLGDGSRDGRLVVVSRDLTRAADATHIAPTLQAALDAWDAVSPELERIARGVETGGQPVLRFHERDALAALPRAYQRLDPGRRHGNRSFAPPRATIGAGAASVALAALTGDLARGADLAAARAAIRLVVLLCETERGATLAPAAVTPDEAIAGSLALHLGSAPAARLDPVTDPETDLAAVVMRAARDRALAAGCLVVPDPLLDAVPLAAGAALRAEIRDAAGRPVFGAIELTAEGEALPGPEPAPGAPTALDHVLLAIPPGAEAECLGFFTGLLGMTEVAKPDALRDRGGVWLHAGSIALHLGVDPDFRPARKAHPAFRVAGLDRLAERLAAAGRPVRWDVPFDGRRRFHTDDPVGNRLELIEA
jgi:catechol 2,3-dioxygenase-like lactoylglutathione lyase family enzyme